MGRRRTSVLGLLAAITVGLAGCASGTVPSPAPIPGPASVGTIADGTGSTVTAPGPASPGAQDADDDTSTRPAPPATSAPATPSASSSPPPGPVATPTSAPPTPAVPPSAGPEPTVPPGTTPPASLLGTDWDHLPTAELVVALTFDAGASDAGVGSILSTLATQDVRATFFLTGEFSRRYPAQVAAIAAAGHRIGNHSDTHEHYPALTDAEIAEDLATAEAAITAAGASGARPWFRFPYGDRTAADVRAVNAAGYVPVRWTVDTLGWKGTSGGQTAASVADRAVGAVRPGEIVLMHVGANPDDGTTLDADALPGVIDRLRAAGYGFVTLDAML